MGGRRERQVVGRGRIADRRAMLAMKEKRVLGGDGGKGPSERDWHVAEPPSLTAEIIDLRALR